MPVSHAAAESPDRQVTSDPWGRRTASTLSCAEHFAVNVDRSPHHLILAEVLGDLLASGSAQADSQLRGREQWS